MSEPRLPSRRDFLGLAAGAFVVAAIPWARRGAPTLVRGTAPAMGTLSEIAVVHRDGRHARAALAAAQAEVQRVERLMTRFRADSDVGRANREAAAGPVPVSPETATVLRTALEWAERSGGEFDPCLARLADLWDVKHRHAPPAHLRVARLAGRRLYRHLDVDTHRGAPVVRFSDRDVALDLGGIACGYGVDRAVAVLRGWGIRDGFVNVGGDIYALGHNEAGEPWQVGIRAPDDPDGLLGTVAVSDASINTSGDYEQHFDFGGRRYGHILEPATGEPRLARTHTVTVLGGSCLATDAASTAIFGLPREAAERILAASGQGIGIVHLG